MDKNRKSACTMPIELMEPWCHNAACLHHYSCTIFQLSWQNVLKPKFKLYLVPFLFLNSSMSSTIKPLGEKVFLQESRSFSKHALCIIILPRISFMTSFVSFVTTMKLYKLKLSSMKINKQLKHKQKRKGLSWHEMTVNCLHICIFCILYFLWSFFSPISILK